MTREESDQYGFHFSDEDFYIYMIVHEYKHYSNSGTGLRSLMDDFVYLRAKGEKLDWTYIGDELQKLGVAEFEQKSRTLSNKLFSDSECSTLTAAEREILEEYLFSGTYGTVQKTVEKRMELFKESTGKVSKFRYLWSRLFPNMEFYKKYYPFFYQHKYLLPAVWIYRFFRGVAGKSAKIRKEIHIVKNMDR